MSTMKDCEYRTNICADYHTCNIICKDMESHHECVKNPICEHDLCVCEVNEDVSDIDALLICHKHRTNGKYEEEKREINKIKESISNLRDVIKNLENTLMIKEIELNEKIYGNKG